MPDLNNNKITRFSLVWPLFLENLFRISLGNVNVLMLGSYSDKAVAAVGVSTQIINMVLMLYVIVSMGSGIFISQFLGANDKRTASRVAVVSIAANLSFGLIISSLMIFFARNLLKFMHLPEELMDYGSQYMRIVGGASFLQALIATMSAICRNFGSTRFPMYIAFVINVINIIGNYTVIFRPFGIPSYGIRGVAISLVISTIIGLCLMVFFLLTRLDANLNFKDLIPFPIKILKDIVKTGAPAAAESLSFSTTQTITTSIITLLGTEALTSRIYLQNIIIFVFILALSIGMGTQILIGHMVGAGKIEEAYKEGNKSLKYGLISNTTLSVLLMLMRFPILSIYTRDAAIIKISAFILVLDIFVEIGRAFNNVLANALRGAGDVRFPMMLSVSSMWGLSVPLCYILGIVFKLGLPGIWIAFAVDEWFRGIMFYRRWRSRAWQQMRLVSDQVKV